MGPTVLRQAFAGLADDKDRRVQETDGRGTKRMFLVAHSIMEGVWKGGPSLKLLVNGVREGFFKDACRASLGSSKMEFVVAKPWNLSPPQPGRCCGWLRHPRRTVQKPWFLI